MQTKNNVSDAKSPHDTPSVGNVQILTLSEDNVIICDKPTNEKYGGINKGQNNLPNGTEIDEVLTNKSGRTTVTGVCGTYVYISGWWFNKSEMMNLPSETLQYGQSPYVTNESSSSNVVQIEDDTEDKPIMPVPEANTGILISVGLIGLFLVVRKYRK